ncbi:flagellar assembly protein FliW [Sulfurimonas aquatica]|uniref:Flagellar assembly factor FliW n=1 Tax=Sulfurimonas aquatica TaxID=2672570 RepID=A0A975B2G8_9BACT|nr:flagellar assembly protein FliW [Sulfurimonas aquatica]QSZ43021.1 flagellar assembly protein FliW [Sulfurimonas aquatica]
MSYDVRGEILGFEDTQKVNITEVDTLISTMTDVNNENITFTIVNPYSLREYSFDVPSDIKVLLEINEKSNVSVYNILVLQKPLEKSTINFLAPIVVNNDNNKLAQVILDSKKNPDFGMAETIESFRKK